MDGCAQECPGWNMLRLCIPKGPVFPSLCVTNIKQKCPEHKPTRMFG